VPVGTILLFVAFVLIAPTVDFIADKIEKKKGETPK